MEFWSTDPISDRRSFDDTPLTEELADFLNSPDFSAGFRAYRDGIVIEEQLSRIGASGAYAEGTVITGEVLPMRAEPGAPDTLDFSSDAFAKVINDPWEVIPPEQWTHRPTGSNDQTAAETTEGFEARL